MQYYITTTSNKPADDLLLAMLEYYGTKIRTWAPSRQIVTLSKDVLVRLES